MSIGQLIAYISVAYASITLGVLLKFKLNGLKGATLWLAPFTPFLVFIVPIVVIMIMDTKAFIEKFGKKSRPQRMKVAWRCFLVTVQIFPLVVACVGEILKLIATGMKRRDVVIDVIPINVREMYQMAF